MSHILILGANSDIAIAVAEKLAQQKFNLYLAGRDKQNLARTAQDLSTRHEIDAQAIAFDAVNYKSHESFYQKLEPKPFGTILAFGYLGDQQTAQQDFNEAQQIIDANYSGAVSILSLIANDLEQKKQGFIAGISSVAGDRGRASNYMYGSAKGALTIFLAGLRNRLCKSGVHVLTIKPGFVATKMTQHLDLPAKMTASPEQVAADIVKAIKKKKNVIYTTRKWGLIMLIIRHIPEFIFKKMSI